jgi:hypothetical protein
MFETLLSVSSSPLTSVDSSCMSKGGRRGGEVRGGEEKVLVSIIMDKSIVHNT